MQHLRDALERLGPDAHSYELAYRADLALVFGAHGQVKSAAAELTRCGQILGAGEDYRGLLGRIALGEAVLTARRDGLEAAGSRFEQALATLGRFHLVWHEAEALHLWGRACLDHGQEEAALAKFDHAAAIYAEIHAGAPWIARVDRDRSGFGS